MRNRKLEIVWLALGLALLAWVAWSLYRDNPAQVQEAFRSALQHPWLLVAAGLLYFATLVASLLKWQVMSRLVGAAVGLRQSLRLFGTLYLVGMFTPGRAGELAVPLLMRGGARLTGVALVNRLLESSWTVFVGAAVALLLFAGGPQGGRLWALAPILLFFALAMLILSRRRFTKALLGLARAALKPFSRLRPVGWLLAQESRYADNLEHFYDANERLLRLGPVLLFSLLMGLIWGLMIFGNYLLIAATVSGGKEVTFAVVTAIMAVNAVTAFLSPIPGGLGLSEFLSIELFRTLGYEQQKFLPFLLLSRVEIYLVVVLFYVLGRLLGRPLAPPSGR